MKTCEKCRFRIAVNEESFCHRDPPAVFPSNVFREQDAPGWLSIYPPVGLIYPGCGKFETKRWWNR